MQLRDEAWAIIASWLSATQDLPSRARMQLSPDPLGQGLAIVGEMPAFVAALARRLEGSAGGERRLRRVPVVDEALREAARAHARARAHAGFTQRDLLAEFVRLRRVIWEHVRPGAGQDGVREHLNQLLDAVLVETADHFFVELTDELTERAERDELTGALNRRAFYEQAQAELNRATRLGYPLTVGLIDLDAFKLVNDTLGHLTGDALLRRIGVLLAAHTRSSDIVGRLGGDEFAVVLAGTDASGADDLARRLRAHLAPARRQLALPGAFGLSIGTATYPDAGETLEELLFRADQEMYARKHSARGQSMQPAGSEGGAGPAPELTQLRVVVVDDDPHVRDTCRATLEPEGWRVAEARDLVEARGALAVAAADVVLLDAHLPDGSGWDLARELAAAEQPPQVVMMTGDTRGSYMQRAVQRGISEYLPKPFTPEDVSGVLNRLVGHLAEVG